MISQIQVVVEPENLRGGWSSAIEIPLEFDVIKGKRCMLLHKAGYNVVGLQVKFVSLPLSAENIMLDCIILHLNQTGYIITAAWSSQRFPLILGDVIESYNVFTSDELEVKNLPHQVFC